MAEPLRIVADTNVLLMALPRKSPYRPIFDAFLAGRIFLLIDTGILLEYLEILEQRTDAIVAQNIGELLANSPYVVHVDVTTRWRLIAQDPDDDKFADCAIAGRADYLVTNDAHFNVLRQIAFPPVNVISIADFLQIVREIS